MNMIQSKKAGGVFAAAYIKNLRVAFEKTGRFEKYEAEKEKLLELGLNSTEYERECRKIADRLKI